MLHPITQAVVNLHVFVSNLFQTADDTVRRGSQISLVQMLLLRSLIFQGCLKQSQIAKILMISQPAVSKHIRNLAEKGFVLGEKTRKTYRNLRITPLGETEYRKAFEIYDEYCKKTFAILESKELNSLNEMVKKLMSVYV